MKQIFTLLSLSVCLLLNTAQAQCPVVSETFTNGADGFTGSFTWNAAGNLEVNPVVSGNTYSETTPLLSSPAGTTGVNYTFDLKQFNGSIASTYSVYFVNSSNPTGALIATGSLSSRTTTTCGTANLPSGYAGGTYSLKFAFDVSFKNNNSGNYLNFDNFGISATMSTTSTSSNQRVITTLPVKFASFTATRQNKNTELRWTTATEINNKGFYVQKKTGGEWKDIAFVFSKTHNGSSTGTLSYSYTDLDVTNSAVQYRIMQVDMDAKVSYSEVRTLVSDKQTGKVVLFPNPSLNGTVTISFDNSNAKEVQVSDLQGRMIKSYPSVNSSSLCIANLPNGFYSIRILDIQTLQVTTAKLVVQK